MDKLERLKQLSGLNAALLSASSHGAVLSTELARQRVESLDLMVKGFCVEMTSETLLNQLEAIERDLSILKHRHSSGEMDDVGEMGEMESLRLQMAMDRLTKLMSTLSNLLKKIAETAEGIVQNLK